MSLMGLRSHPFCCCRTSGRTEHMKQISSWSLGLCLGHRRHRTFLASGLSLDLEPEVHILAVTAHRCSRVWLRVGPAQIRKDEPQQQGRAEDRSAKSIYGTHSPACRYMLRNRLIWTDPRNPSGLAPLRDDLNRSPKAHFSPDLWTPAASNGFRKNSELAIFRHAELGQFRSALA